ncbi:MAG: transcriptional repressor [Candidatus Bathyarchaeia archaeon]
MSHNDIIEILKNEHSLSASALYQKLKEKGYTKSLRTLQRQLARMEREGLIEAHAIGREISYSIAKTESKRIPNHFLAKFWNELFDIQKEVAERELPCGAYKKLRTLVMLLPADIKKEILPTIKKLDGRLNFNNAHLGIEYFGFNPNLDKDGKITHSENFKREIEAILDKLSDLLHKEEGVKA